MIRVNYLFGLALFACSLATRSAEPVSLAQQQARATDSTIRFLEERVRQDPEDFVSAAKLGGVYLRKARESGDLSFYFKSEAVLLKTLELSPDSYSAKLSLASAFNAQHRFREAVRLAEQVLKDRPEEAGAYGVLGDAQFELGDMTAAETAVAKMFSIQPTLSAHTRRAKLRLLRGDHAGAIRSFRNALEAGLRASELPESLAWCQVQLGGIYFRQGQFTNAEACYLEALKIFPEYYLAQEHLAELRGAEARFDLAVELYQKIVTRLPRADLQQAFGDLYAFMGKTAEATLWHDRALAGYLAETKADRLHFAHHLASFYSDSREDAAEALKWARKDLELRQSVHAWGALAWALYKNGEFTAALEPSRKSLAHGTKDAHLFYHAAMIHLRAGRVAEGKAFLKDAGTVNPLFASFHAHR